MHPYQQQLAQLPKSVMDGTNAPVSVRPTGLSKLDAMLTSVVTDTAREVRSKIGSDQGLNDRNAYAPNHMRWVNTGIAAQIPSNYSGVTLGQGIPAIAAEQATFIPKYGCKPIPERFVLKNPANPRLFHQ